MYILFHNGATRWQHREHYINLQVFSKEYSDNVTLSFLSYKMKNTFLVKINIYFFIFYIIEENIFKYYQNRIIKNKYFQLK